MLLKYYRFPQKPTELAVLWKCVGKISFQAKKTQEFHLETRNYIQYKIAYRGVVHLLYILFFKLSWCIVVSCLVCIVVLSRVYCCVVLCVLFCCLVCIVVLSFVYCCVVSCVLFCCLVCIVVVVLCLLLCCLVCIVVSFLVCIVVVCLVCIVVLSCVYCCVVLPVLFSSYVYLLYYVCIAVFTVDAELLARSQYSEGPATGHLDTGFSWFLFCL